MHEEQSPSNVYLALAEVWQLMETQGLTLPVLDFSVIGPASGERFPDIVLPDQKGLSVDLHQTRGRRRALVVFFRSASW